MQDIYAYLLWRGDLEFYQAEFNKVDSLILSQIAYVMFEGVLEGPESRMYITLEEAAERYMQLHPQEESQSAGRIFQESAQLLFRLARTSRFRYIMLGKYLNIIDYAKQQQFAALKMLLPGGPTCIAFRGTDDTIIGWREDFNMAYMPQVPSQLAAADYLRQQTGWLDRRIVLMGHSKGGNLSVYSAVKSSKKIKKRIRQVYNFDGPGFLKDMVDCHEYKEMLPKIQTYVPETSIIGRLLEHQEEYQVVKSSATGILQHDPFSWKVAGTEFVYAPDVDENSKALDTAITSWIEKMESAQREQFIRILFQMLEVNEIRSTGDFTGIKLKKITEFVKTMGELEPENRKIFLDTLGLLWKEANQVVLDRAAQSREEQKKIRHQKKSESGETHRKAGFLRFLSGKRTGK